GGTGGGTADAGFPVSIQILSISDWHGQLDPGTALGPNPDGGTVMISRPTGGASALSAWFQREKATNPNTLIVTAGDEFGASPPLSSFFNEDPAVKALNLMGVQANTFGNHNFDRGTAHLQQMITLATYKYVSTNLNNLTGTLNNVASPFHLIDVGGVKVGIVGITNDDAASLIGVGKLGPITVDTMAASATRANAAVIAAKAAGANIVIALVHMGATQVFSDGGVNGPLLTLAAQLNGFAAILGDHTDIQFSSIVNGQPVVENKSKGLTYARVSMTVHTGTNAVTNTQVAFVTPYVDRFQADGGPAKDPAIDAMLAPYRASVGPVLDVPIGKTTGVFLRNGTIERVGEAPIGNLTADAIRLRYGSTLALTNGGGLRASLPSAYVVVDAGMPVVRTGCSVATPCDLVRGDVFTVLPFGNIVVTRTVTGTQLWAALEHGVGAMPAVNGRFPQISGFKFTWGTTLDAGSRVLSVALADGTPVAKDSTLYTLSTNDFTNGGGDGYLMFADGQGVSREVMADVLVDFIKDAGTISPVDAGRITPQ
ncbi:MAG: putative 5-nucleotidase, partial [Myxococcaceae bacterium]|nr:putative 5-nucleotidase [Myxococcaceae bacterium]